jgi:branched-chain amino acid transport system ATP-binding protein
MTEPRLKRRVPWAVPAVVGVLAAIFVPRALPPYWLTIVILALIFGIVALGLNLLMGYTGLDSLGQAAFFGSAAYFLGISTAKYGWPWWVGAIGGFLLATAIAAGFGLIAVRLKGLYFLLITLALGQVLWGVVLRWGTFTGGWNGLRGVTRPFEALRQPLIFYYAILGLFLMIALLVARVVNSPFGLILRGIRERELRAITLGLNTRWHKYVAFVIAGAIAALAGLANATYNSFVSPRDLSVELSFDAMLMVIVGGTGTLLGPIVGAVVVTALRYLLSVYVDNFWLIIMGAVFIGVTLWMPNGIIGLVERLRRKSRAVVGAPGPDGEVGEPVAESGPLAVPLKFQLRSVSDGPRPEGVEVLSLESVSKSFGDVHVLEDVDLVIKAGERVGIIGLNGAGKTTLFNVISGILSPTKGTIRLFKHDVTDAPPHARNALGLARTFQVTTLFTKLSVRENIALSLLGRRFRKYQYALGHRLAQLDDLRERTDEVLAALVLSDFQDVPVRYLSYGHQRQVEIALALASEPEVLLLDEPTAGLAQGEMPAMVRLLKGLPEDISIMVVEHNLEVIFEVVNRVVVLHQGRVLVDATPAEVQNDPTVQELYFGTHRWAAKVVPAVGPIGPGAS